MVGDESAPDGTPHTVETTGVAVTPRPVSSLELGSAETMPATGATLGLVNGQRVGRFTITGLLGRGGMGEVYAAHDPELDRNVAIKLLRPELSTTRADARLHREARAMARLSHPNLVTVHDVGAYDGRLFVAMELISGGTLRTWARGKSWREIVTAYVAAGRGLAAAHEADIVHRDFKPDNVLVREDGRVAVGDFGLAVTSDDGAEPLDHPSADQLVTQAGALIGTVRYMAPEQLERRSADARSDQFAFCVSLWEALDEDPFGPIAPGSDATTTAETRRDAIAAGPTRKRLARVPARLTRALQRGLAPAPADRWPTMKALLDHIDPARRRNRIALAAAGAGALAAAIGATYWLSTPATDPCARVAAPMAAIWQPGSVARLRAAFEPSQRPNREDAAVRTAAILDRRSIAWTLMRVDSCRATARGDQNAELERRRTRCLDARLAELGSLVGALTEHPTGEMVDLSIRAANGLTPVESCANISALLERAPDPPDPVLRGKLIALEADIARADALEKLGDKSVAPTLAQLHDRAVALDWAPAIAAIDAVIGHDAWRRGESASVEATLREGATAAARAKDDELGARILSLQSDALVDSDRASDAVEVARASALLATRAGDPPALRAEALEALANAYVAQSKFDDADRTYQQIVELLERTKADPLHLARVLNSWANQLFERSDYARALPLSDRALEILRAEVGVHHPDYARVLHSNGNLLVEAHRYADAKARFEEALAIKQQIYGPDEPTVAESLHSLGNALQESGEIEKAGELYQRAYDIWAKKLGPTHSRTVMARYSLALNLKHRKKYKEAIAALEDVLAQRRAAKNPQPQKVANALGALSECYFDLGDRRKAADYAEQALAIREQVLGPNTGDVAENLIMLAEIHAEGADCARAVPPAKRALAILHGLPGGDAGGGLPMLVLATCADLAHQRDAADLYRKAIDLLGNEAEAAHERGRARLALATLVWPSDRAQARELATTAQKDLDGDPDQARANAWLAAHPAP